MELSAVTNSLEDVAGSKFGIVLIGGVVVMALLAIFRKQSDNESGQMTLPTGYTSYPSAEKNADVIIDSVNNNTNYNTASLLGVLDALQKWQSEQFTETNNTIKEGDTALSEKMDDHQKDLQDRINDGFVGMKDQYDNLSNDIKNVGSQVTQVGQKVDTVSGQVSGVSGQVNNVQGQINNQNTVINNLQNLINQILALVTAKPSTSSSSSKSSSSGSSSSSSSKSSGGAPNTSRTDYVNSGPGTKLPPGYGK